LVGWLEFNGAFNTIEVVCNQFIMLTIYICEQRRGREAPYRVGLSAAADTCQNCPSRSRDIVLTMPNQTDGRIGQPSLKLKQSDGKGI